MGFQFLNDIIPSINYFHFNANQAIQKVFECEDRIPHHRPQHSAKPAMAKAVSYIGLMADSAAHEAGFIDGSILGNGEVALQLCYHTQAALCAL